MSETLSPTVSVSNYPGPRSDHAIAAFDSLPSSFSIPQAVSKSTGSLVRRDVQIEETSVKVGIIIGILIASGMLSFLIFLIYRKGSDASISPLAPWRQDKASEESAAVNDSGPMMVPIFISDEGSTNRDAYDAGRNESRQNLVPTAPEAKSQQNIVQKIQQALSEPFRSKPKQKVGRGDEEKGQNPGHQNEVWSRRPASAAGISVPTRSSMASQPSVAPVNSHQKAENQPYRSAFSWSTATPTPLPPSYASMKENPLPPLPSDRGNWRDTTLTTISEDSQPARYRSISSWVASMQTRQGKRGIQFHQNGRADGQATIASEIPAPRPIATPNDRGFAGHHDGSVRFSAMTTDSGMDSPVIETATMARHVQQRPGQVEIHPVSQSISQGPGEVRLQNQRCNTEEQAQYLEGKSYVPQNEHSQQGGEI